MLDSILYNYPTQQITDIIMHDVPSTTLKMANSESDSEVDTILQEMDPEYLKRILRAISKAQKSRS